MKFFIKSWLVVTVILLCSCTQETITLPLENEIVMHEGMNISATNSYGTMKITAGKGTLRNYTWQGATRSVSLLPRKERWYGSLGIYSPGEGNHWEKHDGITRAVLEEGQQHFKNISEAISWITQDNHLGYVYRDDGLVVGWHKMEGAGGTLSVSVWQIYVDGNKPTALPGSQNEKISVELPKG